MKLSPPTAGAYLKKFGFTPRNPDKCHREQNPAAVARRTNETYPAIALRARTEGATILRGDETGVTNRANVARGYSPKGVTRVVKMPARRSPVR